MEGFTVLDYPSHVTEAIEALGRWQREGRLVQREDVAVGLGPGDATGITRQK
jgi:NADPH-dependent curcumin reductase CurA